MNDDACSITRSQAAADGREQLPKWLHEKACYEVEFFELDSTATPLLEGCGGGA